ncbi:acyltransferase, partial [Candidatus Calescamantes bacterium]|nr:acyltransferase [Candidatus Calescamantes bacterium]
MKAAYIQMNPELLDVKANIGKAEKLLSEASADVIVLPELFNTGYTFSTREEILAVSENIPHGP